jgi:hypothetical protein
MTDISHLMNGVFYMIDSAGHFTYTDAGIRAYKPLLKRIGLKPEDICTLDEHRAALVRLKRTAADALELGSGRRCRKS